jgi:hypothetical protein
MPVPAGSDPVPRNSPPVTAALERLLRVIEEVFPVPGRFRSSLPRDVAELSRLLTGGRSERENGYLSRPNLLSAYLRYFLPWNVFRLHRLFSLVSDGTAPSGHGLDNPKGGPDGLFGLSEPFRLDNGAALTDIGSGPLTFPIALWLFRPELRKRDLEFRCVDHSAPALEAGKKLLAALAPEGETAWKIRIIRDSVNAPVRGKKAGLVTAINVFNEVYRRGDPAFAADKAAKLLERLCSDEGSIIVMEPGIPESGAFIAALRDALREREKRIAAPCTHEGPCPLPGIYGGLFRDEAGRVPSPPGASPSTGRGKAKWCHFAFDTAEAPAELHRLSAAAGIPKERAVFSFLAAGKALPGGVAGIRVISDAFPVSGGWGRYACGLAGHGAAAGHGADDRIAANDGEIVGATKNLILIRGTKDTIERITPGTVVESGKQAGLDKKTRALIVEL